MLGNHLDGGIVENTREGISVSDDMHGLIEAQLAAAVVAERAETRGVFHEHALTAVDATVHGTAATQCLDQKAAVNRRSARGPYPFPPHAH